MDKSEIISRLEKIGNHAIHVKGESSFVMSLDDGIAVNEAIDMLKEQEAKIGKWIEQTDYMGDTYYDCSVCNESWITIEGTPWLNGMNYCPHCGAKMEGR